MANAERLAGGSAIKSDFTDLLAGTSAIKSDYTDLLAGTPAIKSDFTDLLAGTPADAAKSEERKPASCLMEILLRPNSRYFTVFFHLVLM